MQILVVFLFGSLYNLQQMLDEVYDAMKSITLKINVTKANENKVKNYKSSKNSEKQDHVDELS